MQVVYWSIKSSFDLVRYAVGSTDSFKGTGVWSFVEFDREVAPASSSLPDSETKSTLKDNKITKLSSKKATGDDYMK